MSDLQVTILGAGQDVGRSCVVVTFPSRRVIFDCGAHCGFIDHRRYPALQLLGDPTSFNHQVDLLLATRQVVNEPTAGHIDNVDPFAMESSERENRKEESLFKASCMKDALKQTLNNVTNTIDCAIISHFHLDHIGALPFLTEHIGYKGPIYMTYPTKALSPILLRDSAQVLANRCQNTTESSIKSVKSLLNREYKRKLVTSEDLEKLDPWGYTVESVVESLNVAIPLQLKSTGYLSNTTITPYYAGHVLGAAIFCVECDEFSVVYTGDFNTIPDKHLGPAKVPPLNPDVLICESTYATVVRQSRRATEMELCTAVHDCLNAGGKVLIPVFAVGRAQELAIILDNYWNKLQITYPIYFGGGLSERATNYYKLHSSWTNSDNIPNLQENKFSLRYVLPFDNSFLNDQRPMVLFATPGMVHAGLSLRACKLWAPNPQNLILIPGYCVQGTIGNKLISGEKSIQTSSGVINVRCKVRYLSFSAHADSAGIINLAKKVQPRNVVLVHGESEGMKKFSKHLKNVLNVPVYYPANGQTLTFTKPCKDNSKDIYFYPELLTDINGLSRVNTNEDDTITSLFDVVIDKEAEDRFKTIALLYDDPFKITLVSKDHLLKLYHSSRDPTSAIHKITHRCTMPYKLDNFNKITELIAKLSVLYGYTYSINEGEGCNEKTFKTSNIELKYRANYLTVEWDHYDFEMLKLIQLIRSLE